ncbi:MAG: hypothetical protein HUJ90_04155, partial [Bacteroidales bacterium]|nr:hypothetical protein [Bacteroidales bacterium]
MRTFIIALSMIFCLAATAGKSVSHTTIATRCGVKGDGKTINTKAFNKAVA